MRGPIAFILVVAAVGLLESPVRAQPNRADAAAAFDRGIEAFQAGHYSDALVAFQRAYEIAPAPEALFNLARTHEELDHPVEATAAYQQYLDTAHQISRAERRDVQAALTRLAPRVAHVVLQCTQQDLHAEIDGIPLAQPANGTSTPVNPGQHAVSVRSGDATVFQDVIQLGPGETKAVQCNDLTSATTAAGTTNTHAARTTPLPTRSAPPAPRSESLSPTFIALLSTGAALFAFGATASAINEINVANTNDDVRTANAKGYEAGCDTLSPGSECLRIEQKLHALDEQQDSQNTWRIIGFAAAGAGLAVAATSLLFLNNDSSDSAQVSITPSGASFRVTF